MTAATKRRRSGALGIASAPLLVAGFLLIGVDAPGSDAAGREYVSYFTDNEGRIWIGAILTLIGLAAFLAFLGGGLRDVLPSGADTGGVAGLVVAAGAAWALFTLMGVTLTLGTASAAGYFEGFTLDADTARLMLGLSWFPSIYSGLAATAAVAATSLSARRTGSLPTPFVRAGFVVAALLLVTAFIGVSLPLFALWVLAAGLVLVSRTGGEGRPAAIPARPATGVPA